jgi:hypothetical protein
VAEPFDANPTSWIVLLTEVQITFALAERYIQSRQVSAALARELRAHIQHIRNLAEKIRVKAGEASGDPTARPSASAYEATRLKIIANNDGSIQVFIDDEPSFRMPRGLAAFFQHLVSTSVSPKDGLLEWHSRDSLLQWLCQYSGRKFEPQYVKQRVYALRRCLKDGGIRRLLVHTDEKLGIRIALRPGLDGLDLGEGLMVGRLPNALY